MTARPSVALVLDVTRAYGSGVLRGISSYLRLFGPWKLFEHDRTVAVPAETLREWRGDGVVAEVSKPEDIEIFKRVGAPVVNVSTRLYRTGFPSVLVDDEAVGRLVAQHFLERDYKYFGFCGFRTDAFSHLRGAAFARTVREAWHECVCFPEEPTVPPPEGAAATSMESLIDWIRRLPRPIGVMACNDIRARHVIEACLTIGRRVPDEVALVGAHNDELQGALMGMELSSVEIPLERVGYRAAALLEHMMAGREAPAEPIILPPVGLVVRASSEALPINDRDVLTALRFIRDNAGKLICVQDVTRALDVSRRSLERRFKKIVGRTIQAEIWRAHVERAKDLLAQSDESVGRIARAAGFATPQRLSYVFARTVGTTPLKYRRKFRHD